MEKLACKMLASIFKAFWGCCMSFNTSKWCSLSRMMRMRCLRASSRFWVYVCVCEREICSVGLQQLVPLRWQDFGICHWHLSVHDNVSGKSYKQMFTSTFIHVLKISPHLIIPWCPDIQTLCRHNTINNPQNHKWFKVAYSRKILSAPLIH